MSTVKQDAIGPVIGKHLQDYIALNPEDCNPNFHPSENV